MSRRNTIEVGGITIKTQSGPRNGRSKNDKFVVGWGMDEKGEPKNTAEIRERPRMRPINRQDAARQIREALEG